jgi:hypothetical protein
MDDRQAEAIVGKLTYSKNGALRKLFYKANGDKRLGKLYTNKQILSKLKIKIDSMNVLEYKGTIGKLAEALWQLRRKAKNNYDAWIDPEDSDGIAHHGFADNDEDKIDSNIEKYNNYVEQRKEIAKLTETVSKQHKKIAFSEN